MFISAKGAGGNLRLVRLSVAILLAFALLLSSASPVLEVSQAKSLTFSITVKSDQDRADVYLDGVYKGRTSGIRPPYTCIIPGLARGNYKVTLLKKGYKDISLSVKVYDRDTVATMNMAPLVPKDDGTQPESITGKRPAQSPSSKPLASDSRDKKITGTKPDAGLLPEIASPQIDLTAPPLLKAPSREFRVGKLRGSTENPAELPEGFTPLTGTKAAGTPQGSPRGDTERYGTPLISFLLYIETPPMASSPSKMNSSVAFSLWQEDIQGRQSKIAQKLTRLKAQGEIADFKLVESGNYVNVIAPKEASVMLGDLPHVSGIALASSNNITARRLQYSSILQKAGGLTASRVQGTSQAQSATPAAVPLTRVNIGVNNNYIFGNTAPNTIVNVSLLTSNGVVKATNSTTSTSAGAFSISLYNDDGLTQPVLGGDTVRVTPQGASTVSVNVVPLTARFNRTAKTVAGTGPVSSALFVTLHHRQTEETWLDYTVNATTEASGSYSASFSSVGPISSDDRGTVTYMYPDGNTAYVDFRPPYVTANISTGGFSGYTPAGKTLITATLKAGNGSIKGIATLLSDSTGFYSSYFSDLNSNPIMIVPGDTLEIAQPGESLVSLSVATITGSANMATDSVSGQAPANSTLKVTLYLDATDGSSFVWTISDASGNYSADFRPNDIRRGDWGEVIFENTAGNRTLFEYSVPYICVHLNTDYAHGYTTPDISYTVTLKDSAQVVKATFSGISYPDGYFNASFYDLSGSPVLIQPGYVVQMVPQTGDTLTVNVVELTAQANVNTDMVQGKGPANSSLTVWAANSYLIVTVDNQGNFTANFNSKVDIKRGDWIDIYYYVNEGNREYFSFTIPFLYALVNSNYVYGSTTPNTSATLTLKDASQVVKATVTVTSDYDGWFYAEFTSGGNPVLIVTGYTVQLVPQTGETLTFIIPELTGQANAATDVVQGKAPPNSILELWIWGAPANNSVEITITVDSQGNYTANLAGKADIRPGTFIIIIYYAPDGNAVCMGIAVPFLNVRVNSAYVYGYTTPNTSLTLTLKDAAQAIKATATKTSDFEGYFDNQFTDAGNNQVLILPGYTVQVVPQTGAASSVIVPEMTAQVNVAADIVQGKGPANAVLTVSAGSFAASVTTDAQGNYTANYAGKTDIKRGDGIMVSYYNADGNRIYLSFTAPYLNVTINSNLVSGYTTPNTSLTLTLKDSTVGFFGTGKAASGFSATPKETVQVIKATAAVTSDYNGYFSAAFKDTSGNTVLILAGNTVELVPLSGETLTVLVISLTAQVNIVTDIIQGQGPVNSILKLTAANYPYYVTTDVTGNYTANFAGKADIKRQDTIEVRYDNPEGNRLFLSFIVPYLKSRVYSNYTWGYITPNVPFNLILKDASQVVKGTATGTSSSNGYFSGNFTDQDGNSVISLPGYLVQLVPLVGESVTVTLPELTALVNVTTDVVQGKGPPSSSLTYYLSSAGYYLTVNTDALGNYTANFAGSVDLKRSDPFELRFNDTQSNTAYISFCAPYLDVVVNTSEVYGYTTLNTPFTLTLKDTSQVVRATSAGISGAGGYFYVVLRDRADNPVPLQPGWTVQVVPQTGETLTVTTIELTAQANVTTDVVSGKAPANSPVEVWAFDMFTQSEYYKTVTADAQGNFTASFAGTIDIKRSALIDVFYINPEGNGIDVFFGVPFLMTQINYNGAAGFTTPNTSLACTLKNASQVVKSTSILTSGPDSYFYAEFLDRDGYPVLVLPGYVVQVVPLVGETLTITVPELTAQANITTDIVQGKGPANSTLEVSANPAITVTTDALGNYTANFTGVYDIKHGDTITVVYEMPDGNMVYLSSIIPSATIELNRSRVSGYTTPNTSFTATLKDTSQIVKATVTARSDDQGYFYADFYDLYYDNIPILPGYVVQVVPQTGETLTVTSVELTAQVNQNTDTVQGKGPANSTLTVTAGNYSKTVTTDAQGNFTASYIGKRDIKRGNSIEVRYYNADHNSISLLFYVPILYLNANSSDFSGYTTPNTSVTLTLKDASQAVKGTASITSYSDGYFSDYFTTAGWTRVKIVPGYVVQMVPVTGETLSVVVPELTAQANITTDVVQGKGPANSNLIVYAEYSPVSATADTQGNYTASFISRVDIQRGNSINTRYYNADGNRVDLTITVPCLFFTLNSTSVSGYSVPDTSVTLTLKDASQVVKATRTITAYTIDGSFWTEFDDQSGNPVPVLTGYFVQVTLQSGETFTEQAVNITAQANIITDVVQGTGPANSVLLLEIENCSQKTITDALGNYASSFAGRYDIKRLATIRVIHYYPGGNAERLYHDVPGIDVNVNYSHVSGYTTPLTPLTVTLKDSSQAVKATVNLTSEDDGYFYRIFTDPDLGQIFILPGYVIEMTPQMGQAFTVTIPEITTQANPATDIIQGKGPANSSLVFWCEGNQLTVDTDAQGNYSANFTGRADLSRGGSIYVSYYNADTNRIIWYFTVPYLYVVINRDRVSGATTPNTSTTVTLKDASQIVKATTTLVSDTDGDIQVLFKDQSNNPVLIIGGYTVQMVPQAGETLTLNVPEFTVQANTTTDTIQGKGPASSTFYVLIEDYFTGEACLVQPVTDVQGNYTANLAGQIDIQRFTYMEIYYSNPDGNVVCMAYFVPGVEVTVNSNRVSACTTPNTVCTWTLKDASQSVKATGTKNSNYYGFVSYNFTDQGGNAVMILPGDNVQLVPQTGETFSVNVVELTAVVNLANDTVQGKAPANSTLKVFVNDDFLNVTADALGNYTANFIGKADIVRDDWIEIQYRNADGHLIQLAFSLPAAASPAAETTLSHPASQAELGADGYAVVRTKIQSIKDAYTSDPFTVTNGIGAYNASLNYPPAGISVMGVSGITPFNTPTVTINNVTGITTFNAAQTSSTTQQPPLTVADIRLRLLGSKNQEFTATLSFNSITGFNGDAVQPLSSSSLTFRRGDVNNSGGVDAITIVDALFIAQYLAGLKNLSTLNPTNAASVSYDGANGDKITIIDALFIAQLLAGMRDASYNIIP